MPTHAGQAAPAVPGFREIDGSPVDWEDLRAAVIAHHGVYRLSMGVLREIGGYGRLGSTVRQTLSSKLAGIGLGHLPAELPSYQDREVLLYQYGTPAADVIAAIRGEIANGAEIALVQLNSSRDIERVREAAMKAAELLAVLNDRCRACLGHQP